MFNLFLNFVLTDDAIVLPNSPVEDNSSSKTDKEMALELSTCCLIDESQMTAPKDPSDSKPTCNGEGCGEEEENANERDKNAREHLTLEKEFNECNMLSSPDDLTSPRSVSSPAILTPSQDNCDNWSLMSENGDNRPNLKNGTGEFDLIILYALQMNVFVMYYESVLAGMGISSRYMCT